MKTTLITLLLAVLCVEQGEPLMLLLVKMRLKNSGKKKKAKIYGAVTNFATWQCCSGAATDFFLHLDKCFAAEMRF